VSYIVVPVENRNGRLPKFDFTRVLYVGPNVGSSALYSASDALYSALLPTLGLTYRTRVKSNFGSQLISAFYRTDNTWKQRGCLVPKEVKSRIIIFYNRTAYISRVGPVVVVKTY